MNGQTILKIGRRGAGKDYSNMKDIVWLLENTKRQVVTTVCIPPECYERLREYLRKRGKFKGLLEHRLRVLNEEESKEWWRFTVSMDFDFEQGDDVRQIAEKPVLKDAQAFASNFRIPAQICSAWFADREAKGWVNATGRRVRAWKADLVKWAKAQGVTVVDEALTGDWQMPAVEEMRQGKSVADVCRRMAACGAPVTYVVSELSDSLGVTALALRPDNRLVFEQWNKMARHFSATCILATQYLEQLSEDVVRQADMFVLCRNTEQELMCWGVFGNIKKPKLGGFQFLQHTFTSVAPCRAYVDSGRCPNESVHPPRVVVFDKALAECYRSQTLLDEDNPFAHVEGENVKRGKNFWAVAGGVVGIVLALACLAYYAPYFVMRALGKVTNKAMSVGNVGAPSAVVPRSPSVADRVEETPLVEETPEQRRKLGLTEPQGSVSLGGVGSRTVNTGVTVLPVLPSGGGQLRYGDKFEPPEWWRERMKRQMESGGLQKARGLE